VSARLWARVVAGKATKPMAKTSRRGLIHRMHVLPA
jgi:hypothetical protein